jgi:hypothetical protein
MRLDNAREHWTAVARAEPAGSRVVYGALAVIVGATSTVLLVTKSLTPTQRAALIAGSLVAWIVLVLAGWARGSLPLRPVLAAIAVTLLCAIATPSYQSKDVFSYTMYGRIVTEHDDNPYEQYPMHYEGDPMRRYVSHMWQRTPDIYGITFTSIMVAMAPVIGESTFLARFTFQLVAAAAALLLLWLLWRRTRSPVALAFVGLHPLLAISVVNGGHPDAIIALGLFVGVLLALERRPVASGLAFALSMSINFTMGAAAFVLAVWAYQRWTRREVIQFASVVALFGALPYAFLSGWFATAHEHSGLISRQSIWSFLGGFITDTSAVSFAHLSASELQTVAGNGTTLVSGLLVLTIAIRHTRRGTPELAVAATTAAFLVGSSWVMPWYGFCALPLFALRKPNLLTWTVATYSTCILIGDQFPSLSAEYMGSFGHHLLQTVIPLAALVCVVSVIVFRPREVLEGGVETESPVMVEPLLAASA